MKARPLVTLCAAITADGKFDDTYASPGGWPEWFRPPPGDILLTADQPVDSVEHLRQLQTRADVQRIICCAGPKEFRRLFERELVGEIFLFVRPAIDGRRDADTLSGTPGEFFPKSVRCRLLKMEVRGQECLLHYRVLRSRAKRAVMA